MSWFILVIRVRHSLIWSCFSLSLYGDTFRLAAHNSSFMTTSMGIKSSVHRQKLRLNALDVVLFGYRDQNSRGKDIALALLVGLQFRYSVLFAMTSNSNAHVCLLLSWCAQHFSFSHLVHIFIIIGGIWSARCEFVNKSNIFYSSFSLPPFWLCLWCTGEGPGVNWLSWIRGSHNSRRWRRSLKMCRKSNRLIFIILILAVAALGCGQPPIFSSCLHLLLIYDCYAV